MSLEVVTEVRTEMCRSQAGWYRTESERVLLDVTNCSSIEDKQLPETECLIEQVVEENNIIEAYKRVYANKGAPGIDGKTVYDLQSKIHRCWPAIKESILRGEYRPSSVRRIEIPKPQGGTRPLGIPTVMDRLIQQAVHQVLSPIFEKTFSDNSYGFRPGRSAKQAVLKAQEIHRSGKKFVVDMDLKSSFDEVNHDIVMGLIRRRVKDARLLKLIRSYLRNGIMIGGICIAPVKGTPQGGPLSPLLSNIMLHELDMELEKRGHEFCRYADDCNIYVRTRRSGERVLTSIAEFIGKRLKLKVNWEKSAVDYPARRKFLGFTLSYTGKIRISKEAKKRFHKKVKELCRKGRGMNLEEFIVRKLNPYLRGWFNYYKLADEKKVFVIRSDEWIRHRLRNILWRQWKRPWTRFKKLMKQGLNEETAARTAFNKRGPWFSSGLVSMNYAINIEYFKSRKLFSLLDNTLD